MILVVVSQRYHCDITLARANPCTGWRRPAVPLTGVPDSGTGGGSRRTRMERADLARGKVSM
jgi:hypothetical protein